MHIREAHSDDVEGLVELWIELMDFHRDRDPFFSRSDDAHDRFGEFIKTKMESDEAVVLVAEQDGSLIGFSMAMVRDYPPVFETVRHGFIQDVIVTERARRQGIGKQLYEETLAWIRSQGISRVELEVASSNPVSQAFWYQMGFHDSIKRLALDLE
jgi:ribosomal protein S18 acetylase RimI-like enzyme